MIRTLGCIGCGIVWATLCIPQLASANPAMLVSGHTKPIPSGPFPFSPSEIAAMTDGNAATGMAFTSSNGQLALALGGLAIGVCARFRTLRRLLLPNIARGSATICGGLLLVMAPTIATATPVTYQFTGHLTSMNYLSIGGIKVGDAFSGTFSYDPADTADSNPSPSSGIYTQSGTVTNIAATVHGLTFVGPTNATATIAITNDTSGMDTFLERSLFPHSLLPPGWSHSGFESMYIGLQDTSQTVFASDSLPAALSLSSFTNSTFTWRAEEGTLSTPTGFYSVPTFTGRIETLAQVPEPTSILMATIGGAGWIFAVRQRRTRR